MSELPLDNMYDILSRIPVKSLARIRCVSNLWRDYINDPHLENMHAKRPSDPMLIMFHQYPSDHRPNTPCLLTFLEPNENYDSSNMTKKPSVMEFMCTESRSRYPNDVILDSCHGLLYSSQRHPHATTLVVIHPLTRERYELPPMRITPFSFLHSRQRSWGVDLEESTRICVEESSGLGFDDSTSSFKMVCVVLRLQDDNESQDVNQLKENLCTMVHVFGTDTWRKIPHVPCLPIAGEGVFANGCLHWLVSDEFHNAGEGGYLGRKIITLDMAKEEFGVINPPRDFGYGLVMNRLVDLNGEVGYVYHIIDKGVEVWVLKESGWVMHCGFEQKPPLANGLIKVLGVWNEKGDVLMTDMWKHVFVYDLESGGLYEVGFDGTWEEGSEVDIRMYRSSLFSTRYSIKN